jgi:hypothetical protein
MPRVDPVMGISFAGRLSQPTAPKAGCPARVPGRLQRAIYY